MIILGLNPGYDSTAALIIDGRIAAIVEEERLSRIKMHLGFPRRAIQEVLRISNIGPAEIDHVTFSFVDYLKAHPVITRLLLQDGGLPFDPENVVEPFKLLKSVLSVLHIGDLLQFSTKVVSKDNYHRNEKQYLRELKKLGVTVERLTAVDHHLSHASSAYYSSGFDECLIVTADGCGDGHSVTVNIGRDGHITRTMRSPEYASPGFFYSSITAFLGFRPHRHEGKITGLAAYGDPARCYDILARCIRVTDDKTSFTNDLGPNAQNGHGLHLGRLLSGRFYRQNIMNCYRDYYDKHLATFSREDIAAGAQQRLEDVFIELLTPIIRETGLKKVALAGGVFANVKLNQRIFEIDGVEEIFIHPNMGDGGNALGSAYYTYAKLQKSGSNTPLPNGRIDSVYLGPDFSDDAIEAELKRRGLRYRHCENIEAVIAQKLADRKVVGRFNGRMEYGPRALGNRSILASASDAEINGILNERLHRTEFMPFAPSVLAEDAQDYFDLSDGNLHAARFMTITCNVRPEKQAEIPAVCHVDGTARPNVVDRSANESYHRILREYKERTGIGVLVNTSFNVHEEPIVCTPADACTAFEQRAVDALAIGNLLVEHG